MAPVNIIHDLKALRELFIETEMTVVEIPAWTQEHYWKHCHVGFKWFQIIAFCFVLTFHTSS